MAQRKRISEWAKEWEVPGRDIIGQLEKLGFGKRKAQSAMTEEEAKRVHAELRVASALNASVGGERLVEGETGPLP